ncbi:hypothetical protein BCR34DRAFT_561860 [Clohesyomyces aquaticus]|uniref:Uncharacterized protein n=1 Tax=Clohesyomyces aquaticus TaxID=1231657 RepID=A0A1Y1ZTS5_9PLEO|nr:hypothetical protein BCR34DRAFT_561860 [Clohesyomyces aquaticus]
MLEPSDDGSIYGHVERRWDEQQPLSVYSVVREPQPQLPEMAQPFHLSGLLDALAIGEDKVNQGAFALIYHSHLISQQPGGQGVVLAIVNALCQNVVGLRNLNRLAGDDFNLFLGNHQRSFFHCLSSLQPELEIVYSFVSSVNVWLAHREDSTVVTGNSQQDANAFPDLERLRHVDLRLTECFTKLMRIITTARVKQIENLDITEKSTSSSRERELRRLREALKHDKWLKSPACSSLPQTMPAPDPGYKKSSTRMASKSTKSLAPSSATHPNPHFEDSLQDWELETYETKEQEPSARPHDHIMAPPHQLANVEDPKGGYASKTSSPLVTAWTKAVPGPVAPPANAKPTSATAPPGDNTPNADADNSRSPFAYLAHGQISRPHFDFSTLSLPSSTLAKAYIMPTAVNAMESKADNNLHQDLSSKDKTLRKPGSKLPKDRQSPSFGVPADPSMYGGRYVPPENTTPKASTTTKDATPTLTGSVEEPCTMAPMVNATTTVAEGQGPNKSTSNAAPEKTGSTQLSTANENKAPTQTGNNNPTSNTNSTDSRSPEKPLAKFAFAPPSQANPSHGKPKCLEAYLLRPLCEDLRLAIEWSFEIKPLQLCASSLSAHLQKLGPHYSVVDEMAKLLPEQLRLIQIRCNNRHGNLKSVQVTRETDMVTKMGAFPVQGVIFVLETELKDAVEDEGIGAPHAAPPFHHPKLGGRNADGGFGEPPFGWKNNTGLGGFGANTNTGFVANTTPGFGGFGRNTLGGYGGFGPLPPAGPPVETTIFTASTEKDGSGNQAFQAITFNNPWQRHSFEELRLNDYNLGRRYGPGESMPAQTATQPTRNLFGVNATNSNTGGLFGCAPTPPAAGGLSGNIGNQNSGALFGRAPTPPAAPAPGNLFGGAANTPKPGLFGDAANLPATGGLFGNVGNQNTGGLFGVAATQPATGGLFGCRANPPANSATGSLFGNNRTGFRAAGQCTQPAAGTPGTLFGAPAHNGGLFGNQISILPGRSPPFGVSTGFGAFVGPHTADQAAQPATATPGTLSGTAAFGAAANQSTNQSLSSGFGVGNPPVNTTGGYLTARGFTPVLNSTGGSLFGPSNPSGSNPFRPQTPTSTATQASNTLFPSASPAPHTPGSLFGGTTSINQSQSQSSGFGSGRVGLTQSQIQCPGHPTQQAEALFIPDPATDIHLPPPPSRYFPMSAANLFAWAREVAVMRCDGRMQRHPDAPNTTAVAAGVDRSRMEDVAERLRNAAGNAGPAQPTPTSGSGTGTGGVWPSFPFERLAGAAIPAPTSENTPPTAPTTASTSAANTATKSSRPSIFNPTQDKTTAADAEKKDDKRKEDEKEKGD